MLDLLKHGARSTARDGQCTYGLLKGLQECRHKWSQALYWHAQ